MRNYRRTKRLLGGGGRLSTLLGLLIILCICFFVFNLFRENAAIQRNNATVQAGPPTNTPQPTNTPHPTPTNTSTNGKVGDTLLVDGVEFGVTKVQMVPAPKGTLGGLPDGEAYLVIGIHLHNAGVTGGLKLDTIEDFKLEGATNTNFGRSINAITTEKVSQEQPLFTHPNWKGRPQQLDLGVTATGVIMFAVSETNTAFKLQYTAWDGPQFYINLPLR